MHLQSILIGDNCLVRVIHLLPPSEDGLGEAPISGLKSVR
jgi:hypothetical protein